MWIFHSHVSSPEGITSICKLYFCIFIQLHTGIIIWKWCFHHPSPSLSNFFDFLTKQDQPLSVSNVLGLPENHEGTTKNRDKPNRSNASHLVLKSPAASVQPDLCRRAEDVSNLARNCENLSGIFFLRRVKLK